MVSRKTSSRTAAIAAATGLFGSLAAAAAQPAVTEAGQEVAEAATDAKSDGLFNDPLLPSDGLLQIDTWRALTEQALENAVDYVPRLLAAVLVFLLFLIASRVVSKVLTKALEKTKADREVRGILSRLAAVTVLVIGSLMAASQAGLAVGSLLASVGVLGLAIGLAAQDSLSNVVAGLTVLWDRPFRVGDRVTIAGEYGTVTDVGLRTTTVETVRKVEVILPNSDVISSKIINHTRTPQLRVDVPVGIGYGESIEQAREVLLEAVRDIDSIAQSPAPTVVAKELGDSSVNLALRVWLRDPDDERAATFALTEAAKRALDEAGIEIPFPQRTLHIAPKTPALNVELPSGQRDRAA